MEPHYLTLSVRCLAYRIACDRNDNVWLLSLRSYGFLLSSQLHTLGEASRYVMRTVKQSNREVHLARSGALLLIARKELRPSANSYVRDLGGRFSRHSWAFTGQQPWSAAWLHPHKKIWVKVPSQAIFRFLTHRSKDNKCYFKPLNLGVICYATIHNK